MNSLEELLLLFIEQNGSAVFGMCFAMNCDYVYILWSMEYY